MARREDARLQQPDAARKARALVNPHRRFPSYRLWHVFRAGMYHPEVGSQITAQPLGRVAAAALLTEGNRAWNEADDAKAQVLAGAAVRFDPNVRPAAECLATAAAARREEQRLLALAHRFARWLGKFLCGLSELSLDNLDAAREAQAALSEFADAALLEGLYRERIEQLVVEALEESPADIDRRRRLWTVAQQFAASGGAEACRKAALRCLAESSLREFWTRLVDDGDEASAARSLGQAEVALGPGSELPSARAVLEVLQAHRAIAPTDRAATAGCGD